MAECSLFFFPIKQKGHNFEIITPERRFQISASSKEDMEAWVHTLLDIVGSMVDENHQLRVPNDQDDDEMIPSDELSNFIRMDTVQISSFIIISFDLNFFFFFDLIRKSQKKDI